LFTSNPFNTQISTFAVKSYSKYNIINTAEYDLQAYKYHFFLLAMSTFLSHPSSKIY